MKSNSGDATGKYGEGWNVAFGYWEGGCEGGRPLKAGSFERPFRKQRTRTWKDADPELRHSRCSKYEMRCQKISCFKLNTLDLYVQEAYTVSTEHEPNERETLTW